MPESDTLPKKSILKTFRTHLSAKLILLIFILTILSTAVTSLVNFHEIFWNIFPLPLIFAAILSGFVHFFLKPLKDLEEAVKVYSKGEFLHRINLHTGDEIEDIAKEFNNMADNLDGILKNLSTDKDTLAFEHNKLTNIISSILDGIIVLNLHREVVLNNQAAEKITGYTSAEMKTTTLDKLITITDAEGAPLPIKELFPVDLGNPSSPAPFTNNENLILIGKDSHKTSIRLTSTAIFTNPQADLGCILVFHDLTHERQLESIQLDFVSMASHELRTPLTSIIGYLSIFLDENKNKLDLQQVSFLNRVMISARQLGSLIENLLSVSKVERGALVINSQEMDWAVFLRQIVDQSKVVAAQKNISLTLELPEKNLPRVKADSIRITEVINNLVSNAITYTKNGGKIIVSAKDIGSEVVTSVSDNGVGIPQEALSHLFTKFFRASGALDAASNSKGTGLGLYISKSIIELHHGRIWANSTLGQGSTFYFTLPAVQTLSPHPSLSTNTILFPKLDNYPQIQ